MSDRSLSKLIPAGVKAPEDTLPGVTAAARDIADVLRGGGRVAVFGDYDPDGTCAVDVVRLAVQESYAVAGIASAGVPVLVGYATAAKGFGLDEDFVDAAAGAGTDILMTVDCGSASTEAVARAQRLGMRVVITDHHQLAAENPAEHHLNPARWGSSAHSGSMVAWKFSLALACELGHDLGPLLSRGAYVAAFGARSDWMDMTAPENAALLAYASTAENVPPGLLRLTERLQLSNIDDDFETLDAVLNLPKRTPRARAQWVGDLLAADTPVAADEAVDALLAVHEQSESALQAMVTQARATVDGSGGFASACVRIPGGEDFTGHAGNVAHELNVEHGIPAVVFIYMGEDAWGGELWRWAARNNTGAPEDRLTDELAAIRAASTVRTASGHETVPSAGGHPKAVSGRCTGDRVELVVAAFRRWAQKRQSPRGT